MRGALMDATLPVVMRRTCVCPSRLLAAAVNCPVMVTGKMKMVLQYNPSRRTSPSVHLMLSDRHAADPEASNLLYIFYSLTPFCCDTISCVCQNEIKIAKIRKITVIDGMGGSAITSS